MCSIYFSFFILILHDSPLQFDVQIPALAFDSFSRNHPSQWSSNIHVLLRLVFGITSVLCIWQNAGQDDSLCIPGGGGTTKAFPNAFIVCLQKSVGEGIETASCLSLCFLLLMMIINNHCAALLLNRNTKMKRNKKKCF